VAGRGHLLPGQPAKFVAAHRVVHAARLAGPVRTAEGRPKLIGGTGAVTISRPICRVLVVTAPGPPIDLAAHAPLENCMITART
jgi:hypothetical protein